MSQWGRGKCEPWPGLRATGPEPAMVENMVRRFPLNALRLPRSDSAVCQAGDGLRIPENKSTVGVRRIAAVGAVAAAKCVTGRARTGRRRGRPIAGARNSDTCVAIAVVLAGKYGQNKAPTARRLMGDRKVKVDSTVRHIGLLEGCGAICASTDQRYWDGGKSWARPHCRRRGILPENEFHAQW